MSIQRSLQPKAKFGYPHEVHVHARCAIGASGAVGTTTGRYVTFAKTATGTYTAVVDNDGGLIDYLYVSGALANDSANLHVKCTAVDTSTGTFTFKVKASDGTDTNPTSGASLCFRAVVVNATVAT